MILIVASNYTAAHNAAVLHYKLNPGEWKFVSSLLNVQGYYPSNSHYIQVWTLGDRNRKTNVSEIVNYVRAIGIPPYKR
jgi:hypothetical protein